ncbi:hypothetical protein V6U90_20380 [Micromonospora sp. CPCC 206060]
MRTLNAAGTAATPLPTRRPLVSGTSVTVDPVRAGRGGSVEAGQ